MAVLLLAHQPLLGTQNNEKTALPFVMGGRVGGRLGPQFGALMPGATTARLVVCERDMPMKAFMKTGGRENEAHPSGKESR
jgi:hypothetical protein